MKEVIDFLEETRHFSKADVFMEPPSDGEMTEGDSADEDEPTVSVNKLSGRQLSAAAVVTMKTVGSHDNDDVESDSEEEVEEDNSDEDTEDELNAVDLPTTGAKRPAADQPRSVQKKQCVARQWSKSDIDASWPDFSIPPKNYNGATDPVNIFEYFFDNDVCEYLADMSTKYARSEKGQHSIEITVADIKCFIAILLLSGYVNVPRWRMLWEVDSETFNAAVSNGMRRSQFENIKRYLHCADNACLNPGDKFAKMRPLMAMLNERYLACASLEEHLCVDESMAPLADMAQNSLLGGSQ